MKISCGIFTNIAPLYSKPLWNELNNSDKINYFFYSAKKGYNSIRTIDPSESRSLNHPAPFAWYFLRNIYLKNVLVFQVGAIYYCIRTAYDVYIFNGEANCISTWLASLICRLKKKPVIFWGHGIYGNEKRLKRLFRVLFYKLADYHLIYGKRSKDLMVRSGFSEKKVFAVFNSLNFSEHNRLFQEVKDEDIVKMKKELFPSSFNNPVLIFLGRLTKEKKVQYLIRALSILKHQNKLFNCIIVGGGSEMKKILDTIKTSDLEGQVQILGENYDEIMNAKLIMMADCCVSPGNIGLTAIHSLSLGTPVITHGNYNNQGPEIEAIIPGLTGMFFIENDVGDLSAIIKEFVVPERKKQVREKCREEIIRHWNPENQRGIFDNIVNYSVHRSVHD